MTRTVIVTGGTSGIGRAVAARFAADGEDVVITGRDAERAAQVAQEIGARGIGCDARSAEDVLALAESVSSVDVLVNAVGGNADIDASGEASGSPLDEIARSWRANLDLNVLGAVLTTEAFRDGLNQGGAVVSFSSIGAERGGGSYGAAKAALSVWSAGLSTELAPRGVTCNVISPGYIEGTNFFRGRLSDERRQRLIAETHDKRVGEPEDVAGLVCFLASRDARHLTGQTLHLNGGAFTTR